MAHRSHALILAAGKGTRLLPVTNFIPKPLFPVLDIACLQRIIFLVSIPAIRRIAVNVHHLADQMVDWLEYHRQQIPVSILREEILLGTGGAVKNAFDSLGYERPILVYNADIVCNLDPARLIEQYFAMNCPLSLLCVHDRKEFNKLDIMQSRVLSFDSSHPDALAYTGIAVISPALFRQVPPGPCSLVEIWQKAMGQ